MKVGELIKVLSKYKHFHRIVIEESEFDWGIILAIRDDAGDIVTEISLDVDEE
jgi:hypothetical protein